MKKIIFGLMLSLVVISGLLLANRQTKAETPSKPSPKPLTAAEMNAEKKKWEATPEGIKYKKWQASPAGQKVLAGAARLSNFTADFKSMEAVITSLSLPPGSRLGFGLMASIQGEEYIISFGWEEANEFQLLHGLKVNDKIILKSHGVSHAPKYAYPIISGDYVEKDGKKFYNRPPRKGGC